MIFGESQISHLQLGLAAMRALFTKISNQVSTKMGQLSEYKTRPILPRHISVALKHYAQRVKQATTVELSGMLGGVLIGDRTSAYFHITAEPAHILATVAVMMIIYAPCMILSDRLIERAKKQFAEKFCQGSDLEDMAAGS